MPDLPDLPAWNDDFTAYADGEFAQIASNPNFFKMFYDAASERSLSVGSTLLTAIVGENAISQKSFPTSGSWQYLATAIRGIAGNFLAPNHPAIDGASSIHLASNGIHYEVGHPYAKIFKVGTDYPWPTGGWVRTFTRTIWKTTFSGASDSNYGPAGARAMFSTRPNNDQFHEHQAGTPSAVFAITPEGERHYSGLFFESDGAGIWTVSPDQLTPPGILQHEYAYWLNNANSPNAISNTDSIPRSGDHFDAAWCNKLRDAINELTRPFISSYTLKGYEYQTPGGQELSDALAEADWADMLATRFPAEETGTIGQGSPFATIRSYRQNSGSAFYFLNRSGGVLTNLGVLPNPGGLSRTAEAILHLDDPGASSIFDDNGDPGMVGASKDTWRVFGTKAAFSTTAVGDLSFPFGNSALPIPNGPWPSDTIRGYHARAPIVVYDYGIPGGYLYQAP